MGFTKKVHAGQKILSGDFREYFGDFFPSGKRNGFLVEAGSDLEVIVQPGKAYIRDDLGGMYQVKSDAPQSLVSTANSTNYVYLHCDNGPSWVTISTEAQTPPDALMLATVEAGNSEIVSIDNIISGLSGLVPPGVIVAWSGLLTNIPSGWLLCDGENGTPNLLGRFLKSIPDNSTDPGTMAGHATQNTGGAWGRSGETRRFGAFNLTIHIDPLHYEVAWIMKA